MPTDLEQLKHHPDVLRVYQARMYLRKEGRNYVARCPFHEDRSPSFKIDTAPGAFMLFKCFGCQESGSVIDFIQKKDGVSVAEAIKIVEAAVGVRKTDDPRPGWAQDKAKVEQAFQPVGQAQVQKFMRVPFDKYAAKFETALAKSTEAQEWLRRERGINLETAKKLHLGYTSSVGPKGGAYADAGWIVFPCVEGETVTCIKYRSIAAKAFCREPGMKTGLFNLEAIDVLEPVYVTEGEFDAAVLEQAGFRAVSLPSSANSKDKPVVPAEIKDLLLAADGVILAGDTDEVGSGVMEKLWAELPGSHLLRWPDGLKDANEVFLKKCRGDVAEFRDCVESLTTTARATVMKGVYNLRESMLSSDRTNLSDHPLRLRFPWPSVDSMAILLPGSVMRVSASSTKMGKSQFVMNFTMHGARSSTKREIVLNYQCELSTDEFANMVAAHLLQKSRNKLGREDYKAAAEMLKGVDYYIGRNETLTTVGPVLDLIEAGIQRLGATVVVLDHIHFICRNEHDTVKAEENASQRIKNMAIKYRVKFIVVGQPRKASKQDRGKVMQISDNKGSEALVSDADAIFAIHRDTIRNKDPMNPPRDDYEPRTEVHMQGGRSKGDGATFTELFFVGDVATFRELTHEPEYGGGIEDAA